MDYLTGFAEVDGMLERLLAEVRGILGDNFVGMYLYGSLVTGDFSLQTSDIDFLVAMHEPVEGDVVVRLKEMHGRLAQSESKWGDELEGYYVHLAALRRYGAVPDGLYPHRERGEVLKVEGEDEAFQNPSNAHSPAARFDTISPNRNVYNIRHIVPTAYARYPCQPNFR